MAEAIDQARTSYVAGMEAKTGTSLEALVALVASWGPGKHGDLVARAKETFGLGHGHANMLIHIARERAEASAAASIVANDTKALDSIYAGSKASLRPLHEALLGRLADLGPFEIAPKKANVSLRRRRQFALVGPGSKGRLEVGVNLRAAAGTDRFETLGPGKMCSHRTFVATLADIDDELLAFVREAYDAAA